MIKLFELVFFALIISNSLFSYIRYKINLNPNEENTRSLDINNDGVNDFVTITSEGRIIAIDGKKLNILWDFSKIKKYQSLSLINANHNSIIIYSGNNKQFLALETATGNKLWEYKIEHSLQYYFTKKINISKDYFTFWDSLENFYVVNIKTGKEILVKRIGEDIESSVIKGSNIFITTKKQSVFSFNLKTGTEVIPVLSLKNENRIISISETLCVFWNNQPGELICYDLQNSEKHSYRVNGFRPIAGGAIIPYSNNFFIVIRQGSQLKIIVFDKKFKILSSSEPGTYFYHYLYDVKWIKFNKDRVVLYVNYPRSLLIILDKDMKFLKTIELGRHTYYSNYYREINIRLKGDYIYRSYISNYPRIAAVIQKIDLIHLKMAAEKIIPLSQFGSRGLTFRFNKNNILAYYSYSQRIMAFSYNDLSETWNARIGLIYNIKKEDYHEKILKKLKDTTDRAVLLKLYTFEKRSELYHLISNVKEQDIARLGDIFKILRYHQVGKIQFLSSDTNSTALLIESYTNTTNRQIILLNNQNGSIIAAISSETFGKKPKYTFWGFVWFLLIFSPLLTPIYFFVTFIYKKLFGKKPAPLKIKVKEKPAAPKIEPIKKDEFTSTVMEFINNNNGEISILELMGITGYERHKCEKLINKMLIDYEGEIKVGEDSNIIYDFSKFTREHEKTINRIIELASRRKSILTITNIAAELDISLESAINYMDFLVNKDLVKEENKNGTTYFLFP